MNGTTLKAIDTAYNYISKMLVSGDNQDLAVAAKNELRKAYELVKENDDGEQRNRESNAGN